MEILLGIILFFQLFNFSFATEVSVIWRKVSVTEPIMVEQENSFITDNIGYCIVQCSSQQSIPITAIQNGRCYCFKLNGETPRGNVPLTAFYLKTARPSDCVSKGYTVYPGLGVCVKYSGSTTGNFTYAQERCNQDGGYLIKIDSQTKMNSAMSHVSAASLLVFVGAFGYPGEEEYRHVRGGLLDPQYWSSTEPGPTTQDFCAALSKMSGTIRGLADVGCHWTCPFFCELLL